MTKTVNDAEYQPDFTDIHDSLSTAYCYSVMTGQWDFCRAFEGSLDELGALADSLIASGLLPQHRDGNLCSAVFQKLIDEGADKTKDPRFIRFAEITKLRFLVEQEINVERSLN